jgi:Spy/CpxP family protein refolding chaperone
MKTFRTTLAALLSGLAILALTAASALSFPGDGRGHGPGRGGPPPEKMIEHMADALDLDEETVSKMRAALEGTREEGEALHAQIRAARHDMHSLMMAEETDREAVMAKVDQLAGFEGDALRLRVGTLLEVHSLLTPEQRAELTALRGERRAALTEACGPSVAELCPDSDGHRGMMRCLFENRDELPEACRDALPNRKGGRHGSMDPGRRF